MRLRRSWIKQVATVVAVASLGFLASGAAKLKSLISPNVVGAIASNEAQQQPRPNPHPEIAEFAASSAATASTTAHLQPRVPGVIDVAPDACDATVSATPAPFAQIELAIHAPCDPNQSILVTHSASRFTEAVNAEGALTLLVPALAENAQVTVRFEDDLEISASAFIADYHRYNRVVLQWAGQAGFELHARELDAEYGSLGHVWHRASTSPKDALTGKIDGTLIRLGKASSAQSRFADVHTRPAPIAPRNGEPDISIELEVTSANCAQRVVAEVHEYGPVGRVSGHEVVLHVPGCEAVGDFLVLNNVLDDVKLASR